ncbi:DVUA0089 family protein, partial [Arthrospira platensis SPKY2]
VDAAILGSPLDSYVGVFDADGGLIDANDDADGWLDSYLSVALDAGTFFVAVTGWPDGSFEGQHWTEGFYRVSVSAVAPLPDDELEPNDDLASATSVSFGYGSPELT